MFVALCLALAGCASASPTAAERSTGRMPSAAPPTTLHLPAHGLAVYNGHTVVLYTVAGHVITKLKARPDDQTWSRHPWLVDRLGRKVALRGGASTFGEVAGAPPQSLGLPMPGRCITADRLQGRRARLCATAGGRSALRIRGGGVLVTVRTPSAKSNWSYAIESPTGRWLLGQLSGECEVPTAVVIQASSGRISGIPSGPLATRPNTIALGWMSAQVALVEFPQGGCDTPSNKTGVYAISPSGRVLRRVLAPAVDDQVLMWG
jgi:hypothetical protein